MFIQRPCVLALLVLGALCLAQHAGAKGGGGGGGGGGGSSGCSSFKDCRGSEACVGGACVACGVAGLCAKKAQWALAHDQTRVILPDLAVGRALGMACKPPASLASKADMGRLLAGGPCCKDNKCKSKLTCNTTTMTCVNLPTGPCGAAGEGSKCLGHPW